MADKVQSSGGSGGIGFIGLLQILFIGLKLAEVISWSWWLVMLPAILSAGLCASILLIVLGVMTYQSLKN